MGNRGRHSGWLANLGRAACLWFLVVCAFPSYAQCLSTYENAVINMVSLFPTRQDSNDVVTESHTWITYDPLGVWQPYDEDWAKLNGAYATTGSTHSAPVGGLAWSSWSLPLQAYGPGNYSDYAAGWAVETDCDWRDMGPYNTGNGPLNIQRPAVVGPNNQPAVAAFWWLGWSVLSDGAPGAVYYAQAAWVGQPNGATGTPTWSWNDYGAGRVDLSCTTCSSVVATSAAASSGCTQDIKITLNYGGFTSDPFWVTIVTPSTMTLSPNYPKDFAVGAGYNSDWRWDLTDTCGNLDAGLDGYELFGQFAKNISDETWGTPSPAPPFFNAKSYWFDTVGMPVADCSVYHPQCANPGPLQTPPVPLSTAQVFYDWGWSAWVGTQTIGLGVQVISNAQQWYIDHGTHQ